MSNLLPTMEATVEIVKSAISHGEKSSSFVITDDKSRKNFLEGIKELYKTLEELEKDGTRVGIAG